LHVYATNEGDARCLSGSKGILCLYIGCHVLGVCVLGIRLNKTKFSWGFRFIQKFIWLSVKY